MLDNYSSGVQRIIALAETYAFEFNHDAVGCEHLLLAFLNADDTNIYYEFVKQNIKSGTFSEKIRNIRNKNISNEDCIPYTKELKEVINLAQKLSLKNKELLISVDNLSVSLLILKSKATELLKEANVNVDIIIKNIQNTSKRKIDLNSISDLHLMGVDNKDPLIGRENEIAQVINALSRRNKPNAILLGEPGVGKTAIVEEVGRRLIEERIPLLKGKHLFELDLSSTVSGTKYRGEFEEKLKKIINKVKDEGNAILFIDEIHNLVKAGGAEGAIDASNILKPYLSRGEIQIVGATTLEEYRDSFEKDKALKRRFQIINVSETNKEETKEILQKIKSIYEKYYSLEIEDLLLDFIYEEANKYLVNQMNPDKSIELLDNSCVIASKSLKKQDVIKTLKKIYNIEINEEKSVKKLIEKVEKEVIGQTNAKKQLEKIFNQEEHINSLFFLGPIGVGKTKTAKIIADEIYKQNIICLDAREYSDYGGINKLIYGNGIMKESYFVRQLKDHPDTLVYIANLDKASEEFVLFIKAILSKKYFYDCNNNKVLTHNTLFIFSSNLDFTKTPDFSLKAHQNQCINKKKQNILCDKLGMEFVSLINDFVHFDYLSRQDIKELTMIRMMENYNVFEDSNVDFAIEELKKEDIDRQGAYIVNQIVKDIIKEQDKIKIN